MVSPPSSTVHQGEQIGELSHLGTRRDSTVDSTRYLSMANADHGDDTPVSIRTFKNNFRVNGTIGSGSSDIEKISKQDQRAYLFLGKPMSIVHELAFFAVVSTANFTPRGYSSTT
jgi:hypothetical protein